MPQEMTPSPVNEALIHAYLEMIKNDNYQDFGSLLTDDCTFSYMPTGYTFRGRHEVMDFALTAGGSRKHDERSNITVSNWFTDGSQLCIEYDHSSIIKRLHFRMKIDGYCLVLGMRDGKFDSIREYINPSNIIIVFFTVFILRLVILAARLRGRSD